MSFIDKVVIVTGSGSGIGEAIAISFSKEGAKVVLVGRTEAKLKTVSEKCEKHGSKPLIVPADVSKDEDVKRIIDETIKEFSKLDVLVNNAAALFMGSILKGNALEMYDKAMNTNMRSVVNLTRLAAPYLIKTKGNIINISSIAGLRITISPDFVPYAVSKAAMNHFSRGVALELAPHGVRVNIISPGPVKTGIAMNSDPEYKWEEMAGTPTPLWRIAEPEEIADLVLFVASDKARSITGANYVSDNGSLLAS